MAVLYNAGVLLARFCFNVFGRVEVEGREWVPPYGPLIIVSNHLSNADPPLIAATMPRRVFFMAKRGLFANPIAGRILRDLGVYPLDRDRRDFDAVRWALKLLERDQAIAIFPEGTRSRDGQMHRGIPGIAYLALKSQAPILPVGITGTERVRSLLRVPFPLTTFRVRIGQPFTLPQVEGRPSRDTLQQLTDMIMFRVAELLPEPYRGEYRLPTPGGARA